jgi:hypothetical protein
MTQPDQMTVIYLNETNQVLAAVRHSAALPDLTVLVGSDGLYMCGMRGTLAPAPRVNYGAPPRVRRKRSQKSLPFNLDAFTNAHAYLIDASTVTKLPPPSDSRAVRVEVNQAALIIESTGQVHPNSLQFPATRVFIQIEGPDSTDRRVIRGVFPQNASNSFQFPITAEPGGPLASIALGKRYFILVVTEGQVPDARTRTL